MDFLLRCSAFLLSASVFGFPSALSRELRDGDAFCDADGCFVVYLERKIFLDSWRSCKERGGNLATIKRRAEAASIAALFSSLDLRGSRAEVKVWIGLQRQPRQCSSHPLRGFSWTTGDQDTEYTNWQREKPPGMCGVPRCVALGFSTQDRRENFMWGDRPCSDPVDGYLCRFAYRGMCPALRSEGAGSVSYSTPFDLVSTLLTHLPPGSSANVPCPANTGGNKMVVCTLRKNGQVEWSEEPPLCPVPPVSNRRCTQGNGGCDHVCRERFGRVVCECIQGFYLQSDGWSCEPDVCRGNRCEFDCLPRSDGYECACPHGYQLASDGRSCPDVDECLRSPCPQLCQNLPGTFECRCREGYLLTPEGVCLDVDECLNGACEHYCINTEGSYSCSCEAGFSVDSEEPGHCVDVDECRIAGLCEQLCVNHVGGFQCSCVEGYQLLSDQRRCQKMSLSGSVTPPSLTVRWPDFGRDPWTPEPSSDRRLLNPEPTAPSSASDPEVTEVTGASQDPPSLHSVTQRSELEQKPQWEVKTAETLVFTATSLSSLSHPHEADEDDATSALPVLPTSTISEGAWNWWPEVSTSSQRSETPAETQTDPDRGGEAEQRPGDHAHFPGQTSGDDATRSTVPTEFSPLPPDGEHEQINTAVLVGVLVSVCVLIVLMVAAAVCCRARHRGVKPRNKNATECYHWISDAHGKQGALGPSAGDRSPV
ncbi:complement component C1q receptor-like [Cyprinodon tularosa]|uniref:complement component C1q receptor-like n=1 Tax=Cyprinodon tularosa TaxID=77115 RepID=UPI0018E2151B|nr:complement component C1q receptor-like [Cyprinodon tularosa]